MSITSTRTSNNLTVISASRWPDGRVLIQFSIARVGVYYNVRTFTKALTRRFPNGFLMTPALGDLRHSGDPIMVTSPGQVFTYVWDAPVDGYGTGSLYGITFQLGYVDFLCCDETEGGFYEPGGAIPPGERVPAEPPSGDGDGGQVPAPGPGVPPADTVNPGEPHVPPPVEPVPNAGLMDPPAPEVLQHDGWLADEPIHLDGGLQGPSMPDWYLRQQELLRETLGGAQAAPVAPLQPTVFPFFRQVDTTPVPVVPEAVGIPQPVRPAAASVVPGTVNTDQTNQLEVYRPLEPYRVAPEFQGLIGLPRVSGGLSIRGFIPQPTFPNPRSNLYYVVQNDNPASMFGIHSVVLALDPALGLRVVQEPTPIQASSAFNSTQPPGVVPPGTSAGDVVCIDWPQFGGPNVMFYAALLNQNLQPLVVAPIPGFWVQPGTVPPPSSQTVDDLGPALRAITGFPYGMLPKYEGSVNGVGEEDTYVFVVQRQPVRIVVKIPADAQQMKFDPVMYIYNVNDMDTPVVVHSSRFQAGGVDLEPEAHIIGFSDDAGVLQMGFKYAIVIKHSALFYSRRWAFRIFHDQQIVDTGGSLSIVDGNLSGQLSCSYGRQAIKIYSPRLDQAIFVRTNERGATTDLQRDTTEGTNGRRLPVAIGDKLEIIRPGPGVLYRRHGDKIGEAQL